LIFPLLAGRSGAVPFFFFAACMVVDLVLVLLLPETARVALEDMQHAIGSDFQVQLRREAVR
jgi:hypothetical protein